MADAWLVVSPAPADLSSTLSLRSGSNHQSSLLIGSSLRHDRMLVSVSRRLSLALLLLSSPRRRATSLHGADPRVNSLVVIIAVITIAITLIALICSLAAR